MPETPKPDTSDFDVVIIGGSLSGSAAAVLLLREQPTLRVLVVERSEVFGKRVGESTVELSSYFLGRVLGLTRHLNEQHIVKQGFRYWFTNDQAKCFTCSTEMGGKYLSRVASYQIDRSTLDEEVLRRATAAGATVWRPAAVREVQLTPGGMQTLTIKRGDETAQVTARWIVDASGRQAFIAHHRAEVRPVPDHPTLAVWARFENTLDFDGEALLGRFPDLRTGFFGTRHTATNHLMGDGWWAWVIPMKDGQTSVGVTWDERLFTWPRSQGGSLTQQLVAVLSTHPVGRELLAHATAVEGDTHIRRHLPYLCDTPAGDGFALVGDAAGFLDPFYSMGLDAMAMTVLSSVGLIVAERRGEVVAAKLTQHNHMVRTSYIRWFEAIYRDKYVYMGDYELMKVSFLNDIGLYYFGLIMPPYRRGKTEILHGMFATAVATPFYWYMRWVNRRLVAMGASRRQRGTFGRRNVGGRDLVAGFAFNARIPRAIAGALWLLFKLELREGWRTWFRRPGVGRAAAAAERIDPKSAHAKPQAAG